jgi:hypothetical protein
MPRQVASGGLTNVTAVFEQSEGHIAAVAKQAANPSRRMAVIDMCLLTAQNKNVSADRAFPALGAKYCVVLCDC